MCFVLQGVQNSMLNCVEFQTVQLKYCYKNCMKRQASRSLSFIFFLNSLVILFVMVVRLMNGITETFKKSAAQKNEIWKSATLTAVRYRRENGGV